MVTGAIGPAGDHAVLLVEQEHKPGTDSAQIHLQHLMDSNAQEDGS